MRKKTFIFLFVFLTTKLFCVSPMAFQAHDDRKYYNQGIKYAEENKLSLSVLYLKRAYLLAPLNSMYSSALNRVRSWLNVPTHLFELGPVEKVLLFPFFALGMNRLLILGVFLFFLGSVLLSLIFLNFLEKRFRLVSYFLMIFGVLFLFSSFLVFNRTFNEKIAIVLQDSKLLQVPSTESEILSDIRSGFECRIERSMGNFYLIKSVDGREGWIDKKDVKRVWQE